MMHRIGTLEQCQADDATISANCGYPKGGTINWANPCETTTVGVFAYSDFPQGGRDGVSYDEATNGVVCVVSENVEFQVVDDE